MVKEWPPFGWIYQDTEIVMVIKMIRKELCGLGEIGLYMHTTQISPMISLSHGKWQEICFQMPRKSRF